MQNEEQKDQTGAQQNISNPMGDSTAASQGGDLSNERPDASMTQPTQETSPASDGVPIQQSTPVSPQEGAPQTGPTENTNPTASETTSVPVQNTEGALHTMQQDMQAPPAQPIAPTQPIQGERAAGVMPDIEQDIAIQKKNGAHTHTGLWWAIGIVLFLLVAGFIVAFLYIEGMISM